MLRLSKRMIAVGLGVLAGMSAYAERWEWDFSKPASASGEYWEVGGAAPVVRSAAGNAAAKALRCTADAAHRLATGKIDWQQAEITLEFTPGSDFRVPAVLFAYQENTWGRAHLTVGIDEKHRVYVAIAIKNDSEDRAFTLASEEAVVLTPERHTVTVALASGGKASIRFDGRVVAEGDGAMSFADFTAPPVDVYHPFATLGSTYYACDVGQPFLGDIHRLALRSELQSVAAAQPGAVSRGDCNLTAADVSAAPVVDGNLNEDVWRRAEWSIPFLVMGGMSQDINGLWLTADEKFAAITTRAAMLVNDGTLYVAFDAAKPRDMELVARQQAGPDLWQDDCVEFFLRPPGEGYYQVLVNAAGKAAILHYPHADGGAQIVDIPIRTAAAADADGFRVEIALPLAALGAGLPVSGDKWTANFAREGATTGGMASWAPVGTSFLAPERFGSVIFGSRRDYFRRQLAEMPKSSGGVSEMAALEQEIEASGDDPAYWVELHNRLDSLRRTLVQAAHAGKSLLLWEPDIWGNYTGTETIPFGRAELEQLTFTAPGGARSNAGTMIANLTGRTALMRLVFKPDAGTESVWQQAQLRWREVEFMELNGGAMMPDMLFELPLGNTVRIPPNRTLLLWADVNTAGLASGEYGGTVELIPAYKGFEAKQFRVVLQVSPVDVSDTAIRVFTYDFAGYQNCPELAEFGFNCFFFQAPQSNCLETDASGRQVWPEFDRRWQSMIDAGIPKEDILIIFYPEFALWGDVNVAGKTLKFLDPEWKKVVGERLRQERDYMRERYGIGYEQYVFYTTDEPHGDPADPASKAYFAIAGGKWLREVDPSFRLMTNPYQGAPEPYCEMYDILEPFFPPLTTQPGLLECYQNSGKELWSYSIFEKSLSPNAYRRLYWNNMASGIFGAAAFYAMEIANGDAWNSYDESPGSGSTADYATVYFNGPRMMSSRRMQAWSEGGVDLRLAQYCRERIAQLPAAEATTKQEQLHTILQASRQPGADFTSLRRRLLTFAESLR